MQNITVWWLLITGTTDAASSDVQPMTSSRFFAVANRLPTAGTASAGSPLVSAAVQTTLWPSMSPALLIAWAAPAQATRYVGPSAASGPLNGATSANVSAELAAGDADELPLHAASAAVSATAAAMPTALIHRCLVRALAV